MSSSVWEKIKSLKQQLKALQQGMYWPCCCSCGYHGDVSGTHAQYVSELEQQLSSKQHRIFIAGEYTIVTGGS